MAVPVDDAPPRLHIIGVVRSTLKTMSGPPPNGDFAGQEACLEIFPAYCLALAGIERLSRLQVLYWLHRADREVLRVYPGGDRSHEMVGVFTNRSPLRPNPIGVTVVSIVETGIDFVRVRGLDAIDGTPLIDLKAPPEARSSHGSSCHRC